MMFQYTLEYSQRLESMYNLDTVISTDSDTIINYCKENNVRYIKRDKHLCGRNTKIDDVIYDAYNQLGEYDYISLLYADIPTRHIDIFKDAIEFLDNHPEYDCVMSMKHVKCIPSMMFIYNKDILPVNKNIRHLRQDTNRYMRTDSHTVLFKSDYFKKFMEGDRGYKYLYQQFGAITKPLFHNNFVSSINGKDEFELVEGIVDYYNSRNRDKP